MLKWKKLRILDCMFRSMNWKNDNITLGVYILERDEINDVFKFLNDLSGIEICDDFIEFVFERPEYSTQKGFESGYSLMVSAWQN